ncbi:MAG: hypothetical protein ACLTZI_04925 [[Eubacterium] siraeum]
MLARNIGSTVPKAELYENVWGLPYSDNAQMRCSRRFHSSIENLMITKPM